MKYLAFAAACLTFTAPVAAAITPAPVFNVTYLAANVTNPLSEKNEYRQALINAGYSKSATSVSVQLSGAGTVTYEYLGSESTLVDTFSDGPVGPFAETNANVGVFDPVIQRPFAPVTMGSRAYTGAGALMASFLTGSGETIGVGSARFAVFTPTSATAGFSSNVLYFSLDDRPAGGADADYDDFIVRATINATAVPEPATWAMMLSGMGLVGGAMRRRSVSRAVAA